MTTPRASALLLGLVVALVIAFGGGWLSGRTGLFMRVDPATLEARERAFVEQMRNVVLDGSFTMDGRATPPCPVRRRGSGTAHPRRPVHHMTARMRGRASEAEPGGLAQ